MLLVRLGGIMHMHVPHHIELAFAGAQLQTQHVQEWIRSAQGVVQYQQRVATFLGKISEEMAQTTWNYVWPEDDT
eukprot:5347495-Amphidinium_carterae.1